jgi:hypothetical protein
MALSTHYTSKRLFNTINLIINNIVKLLYKAQKGDKEAYEQLLKFNPKNEDLYELLIKISKFYLDFYIQHQKFLTEVDISPLGVYPKEISEVDIEIMQNFLARLSNKEKI